MSNDRHQLRLLPAPQPLVTRLGIETFHGVPRAPGVYRFFGAEDELLYVGKARDLRARLDSYRRTRNQSRKTIRLIHAACRLEWEVCKSETAALLRENELLRTLRPRFNRVGTWPRSARFVVIETHQEAVSLRLVQDPVALTGPFCFGAFRGAGIALAILARLLWLAGNPGSQARHLPHAVASARTRRSLILPHPDGTSWAEDLRCFFAGDHDHLAGLIASRLSEPESPFERGFVGAQFDGLADFYRRGPFRIRQLQIHEGLLPSYLPAERLDDLKVSHPVDRSVPPFRPDSPSSVCTAQDDLRSIPTTAPPFESPWSSHRRDSRPASDFPTPPTQTLSDTPR